MKVVSIVLCTISCVMLCAGQKPAEPKRNGGFDRMVALVGNWTGKDADGKTVSASYNLVSAGSTILETLDMADEKSAMVTMYHKDGDKMMMTHYCSMGNQPRMRSDKLSAEPKSITFTMFDATGMAKKSDSHMSKLVVTFTDDDHFTQEWSMSKDGKVAHVGKFDFARAK